MDLLCECFFYLIEMAARVWIVDTMNLIRKVEILGNLLNEKQEKRCYFHFKLNL